MTLAAFKNRASQNQEAWRYTNLDTLLSPAALDAEPFPHGPHACPFKTCLVFLNGIFEPSMSRFGSVPSCLLMGDRDSGYSLTLGEQTCLVAHPVELVFASDSKAPDEIPLKFSISLGKNARLSLLENHRASAVPVSVETSVTLAPHAKFVHGKIVSGGPHLALYTVHAAEGSFYTNTSLLRRTRPARNEFSVHLDGQGAQVSLNGIMFLNGHDHADTTAHVLHNAPHCTSRQSYKSVLDESARGVFQGRITVAPHAQKTDGYQISRALLLSDKAEMDSKPELEIYADDVSCRHGNSVGDLDPDALFYLRSRGLDEKAARDLLIQGFLADALDSLPVEAWGSSFRHELGLEPL
ncbi:MAG: Fe-S cluster assembly protein SufD [Alphaproteobacteria bacterium]|nr:Fe-S cluster assembly protein SufD [Alphaproteobacteria bacterium]